MFILHHQPSIANHFLAEMRDIRIQTDRMRFRKNMERLGEILAYEISKTLDYQPAVVQTPLATGFYAIVGKTTRISSDFAGKFAFSPRLFGVVRPRRKCFYWCFSG